MLDKKETESKILELIGKTKKVDPYGDTPLVKELRNLADVYTTAWGKKGLSKLILSNYKSLTPEQAVNLVSSCYLSDRRRIEHSPTKPGYYPYIGYSQAEFFVIAKFFVNNLKLESFVDVGSGPGDKVLLALTAGFSKVSGIEVEKSTAEIGNFLLNPKIKIRNEDAFDLNKLNEDLVYIYHPIEDEKLYLKFLIHLLSIMKPGSYLVEVLTSSIYRALIYPTIKDKSANYYGSSEVVIRKDSLGRFEFNALQIEDHTGKLKRFAPICKLNLEELKTLSNEYKGY